MSGVDIGFAETCSPWRLTSPQFPSKIGGKPAWLSYKNLPTAEDLQCAVCGNQKTFLCQVNASCNGRNDSSSLVVFRDNLACANEYYSHNPPPEDKQVAFESSMWTQLCQLCGCAAEKVCGRCAAPFCSRQHQESHMRVCNRSVDKDDAASAHQLREFELVIEPEEVLESAEVNVAEQMRACEELLQQQQLADVDESELERFAAVGGDRTFTRFRKRVAINPEQVLRYERGGTPLWIAAAPTPEEIPDCECGARRRFEFQVMPQFLSMVKFHEGDLDFGVLAIYTCERSCWEGEGYKKEFAFKQDVAE